MNADAILAWMQQWVERNEYEFEQPLADRPVTEIIDSSMDVVEFTMDLEDAIGFEDELDLEEMAPKFASLTFRELSQELEKLSGGE